MCYHNLNPYSIAGTSKNFGFPRCVMFFSKTPILIHVTGCLKVTFQHMWAAVFSRDKKLSGSVQWSLISPTVLWDCLKSSPSTVGTAGGDFVSPIFLLENQSCLAQSGIFVLWWRFTTKTRLRDADWGKLKWLGWCLWDQRPELWCDSSCWLWREFGETVEAPKDEEPGRSRVEKHPKFANFVKWKLWSWKRTRFVS